VPKRSPTNIPDLLVQLGTNVRSRRLTLEMSQEQLAELSGLHRTYIGMVERAEKNITILNVEKLSLALGCSVSELLDEAKD